jgi:hypothetical protein
MLNVVMLKPKFIACLIQSIHKDQCLSKFYTLSMIRPTKHLQYFLPLNESFQKIHIVKNISNHIFQSYK